VLDIAGGTENGQMGKKLKSNMQMEREQR